MRVLIISFLLATVPVPALAQDEYGGGLGLMSVDAMGEVNRQMAQRIVMTGFAAEQAGMGRAARAGSGVGQGVRRPPAQQVRSPYSLALAAGDEPGLTVLPAIQTSFTRSRALQKQSQDAILAVVGKRQPQAVAEYASFFNKYDIAALFAKATADYGFRSNDVADTLAAYWLVAWVVANDGGEPSPAAARAVRDQVRRGIAGTDVAGFSPARRHQLADEAIFNMIVLIELYDYTQKGRISRADFGRVGDATHKAFLGFGADLRQLRLTDAGFVKQ